MSYGLHVHVSGRDIPVRSSLDPSQSRAVVDRFHDALEEARQGKEDVSPEELLVLVALNTTQILLDTEAQVAYLSQLLNTNGYPPSLEQSEVAT